MLFNRNKYYIVKSTISLELTQFLYSYFLMKRQVSNTLRKYKINTFPFSSMFGYWTDSQVPNTYSHYADIAMETLLLKCQPIIEKYTNLKLNPSYSYARIYKKGDVLKRHKDRFSCEISSTLNLGGESWPIYLNTSNQKRKKPIKVDLNPSDMLIYKGCSLDHWRNQFKGINHCQVFLHYNNLKTKGAEKNLFDKREHLGIPRSFKKIHSSNKDI